MTETTGDFDELTPKSSVVIGKTQTGVEREVKRILLDTNPTTALLAVIAWVVALVVGLVRTLILFGVFPHQREYQSVLDATAKDQHGWARLPILFYEWVFPFYALYVCVYILRSRQSIYWKVGATAVAISFALALLARALNREPWLWLNNSVSSALSFVAYVAILVGIPLWFRSKMRYV